MKKFKWIQGLAAALLGCSILFAPAAAKAEAAGEISIGIYENGNKEKPVPGGVVNLVKVADYDQEKKQFALTEEFAKSDIELKPDKDGYYTAETAEKLAAYNADKKVKGTNAKVNDKGIAYFAGQEDGLYLCTQVTAADGYEKINPFLVALPTLADDGFENRIIYAGEKAATQKEPTPVTPPGVPQSPGGPTGASKPPTAAGSANTAIELIQKGWYVILGAAIIIMAFVFRKYLLVNEEN